ncbi:helix-turn-helix domain-containing protein [Ferruginibacter sp. SUN106]|uniref:helix-turn-helix domain-containing protein n=1 Tax=Ferruginibacter sp. SUN106 TaxID=2978348 RepID=UPI003D35A41A
MIHSMWQIDHRSNFNKEYILPKGVVEIIFNFSDGAPIVAQLQNTVHHLPHCFINGFNTTPIEIQLPGQQVFFGVVFQPLAIKKIFGCHAGEFADTTVDLTLIDASLQSLWHQLAAQDNFDKRVVVFLNWINDKCIDWLPQEQLINKFLYADNQHELSVQQLANAMCYSPRHLARKIVEATGMNTEEILLYKKYLHAVHLIHHTNLSMTAIAYQSQFSDQSHFIRSFKTYSKITPGEYKRNKSSVKGHLYKDVR